MPGPLLVIAFLGIGALLLGAGSSKKPPAPAQPPGGSTPPAGWPAGVPWPLPAQPPSGWPSQLPWPGATPSTPSTPGAPGPRTSTGCELDAQIPASFVPTINEALTRTDIPAAALQGLAALCGSFGFQKTSLCVSARASELAKAQPAPANGTTPGGWPAERPPWYPAAFPWPPPFPAPFPLPATPGASTTPGGSTPSTPSDGGWGPRPAALPSMIPWPPPIPFPAAGTPAPSWWPSGIPWPGGSTPSTPQGSGVPPYEPGDIPPQGGAVPHEWGPRPATFPGTSIPYPASLPWPPVSPLDPNQNPIVGSNVELQIRAGDTPSGFAAYYSGPGPGYDQAGNLGDVDLGPWQARLAEFAALNPQCNPAANWSGFQVGQAFYVPTTLAEVRGKPPLPTKLYQGFAGFVPRAGMTDAQILAGITATLGG